MGRTAAKGHARFRRPMARGASVVDLQLLPAAVGRVPGSYPEYPSKGECGGAPLGRRREEAGDLPALALPRSWTRSTRCLRTCRFPGECTVQLLPEPDGSAGFRAMGGDRWSFCKYRTHIRLQSWAGIFGNREGGSEFSQRPHVPRMAF